MAQLIALQLGVTLESLLSLWIMLTPWNGTLNRSSLHCSFCCFLCRFSFTGVYSIKSSKVTNGDYSYLGYGQAQVKTLYFATRLLLVKCYDSKIIQRLLCQIIFPLVGMKVVSTVASGVLLAPFHLKICLEKCVCWRRLHNVLEIKFIKSGFLSFISCFYSL